MFRQLFRPIACLLLLSVTLTPALAATRRGSASSKAAAEGTVNANFFYTNLGEEGTWFNTTEYGDVWRPKIADRQPDWRPYTDGSWAQTEQGWTWISNESFGWATYHYGRWTDNVRGIGWVWVPGYDWAPAWVTFRTSDQQLLVAASVTDQPAAERSSTNLDPAPLRTERSAASGSTSPQGERLAASPAPDGAVNEAYIGWAPLPPEATWSPQGIDTSADADFEIRPEDYCFVPARYFGAPIVREVLWAPARNYYFVEHSYNVTRIAYLRGSRVIHVGGLDPVQVRSVSERPIPQLSLQRQTNPRLAAAAIGSRQFNRVEGNRLVIAGPRVTAPTARTQLQRPPVVKAQVMSRASRPTQAGVDAQTVQRVQQHVARQRPAGRTTASSSDRAQARSTGGGNVVRTGGAPAASTREARNRARSAQAPGVNASSNRRVARSGGGVPRYNGAGRVRAGGGQQRVVFRPQQQARFRPAPQRQAPQQQAVAPEARGKKRR